MLGSLVIALVALGALATGAAGAKPRLWLVESTSGTRAAAGTPVNISVDIDECRGLQPGALASNGKPVDQVKSAPSLTVTCFSSEKLAGSIKSVAFAAAPGGNEMAMTLNSVLHIQFEPWCTYALPHKIAFGSFVFSESAAEPTAPLDRAASFASCAPTRTLHMHLEVEDAADDAPFAAEVVG